MASITLSLTGNIDGTDQTVSKTATIDDKALPYFLQYYQKKFGFGTPITETDAFNAFSANIMDTAIAEVTSYVRSTVTLPTLTVTPNG